MLEQTGALNLPFYGVRCNKKKAAPSAANEQTTHLAPHMAKQLTLEAGVVAADSNPRTDAACFVSMRERLRNKT